MKKSLCLFLSLVSGIVSTLAIAQPTFARLKVSTKGDTTQIWETDYPNAPENITTQRLQSAVIEITDVQLNQTETGLEIIFNTPNQQLKIPVTSTFDNALTADIPNAILNLTDSDHCLDGRSLAPCDEAGSHRFEVFEPAPGIALVSIDNLPGNFVSITVTGLEAPPTAEISSLAQGLLFNVNLGTKIGEVSEEDEPLANFEILVTAEKKLETLQDVPISITVITEEDIENADITSFGDAARNVPNFSFFPGSNRFSTFYSVRGFSNASSLVSRDPVDFYVDGVPYNFGSFLNSDLPDLERIEVLRGPQSVLYGRNAIAGVINVITKKPTNEFEFNVSTGYANFDNFDLRASISGPLVKDQLFYRLLGSFETRDGFTDNDFLDNDVDDSTGGTGRGQLLWTPSENWEISFNASFEDYAEGGLAFVDFNSGDPFEADFDVEGFNELISNTQALNVKYSSQNFLVTSITNRRFSSTATEFDVDASSADGLTRIEDDATGEIFSQELRIQSPDDAEKFEWLLGIYYEFNQFDFTDNGVRTGAEGAAFGFPFPPGSLNLASVETDSTTLAVFGQTSYYLTKALTLTAGLRYESTSSELVDFERVLSAPGAPSTTIIDLDNIETSGDELLPRFVAEYRFSPNSNAYASVTRGYRPPGINLTPDNVETATFGAERSWNFELGLKNTWFDNRLQLNLAGFFNSVNDFQVLTFDDQFNTTIENADVNLAGAELEVKAVLAEGLDITAGVGFVDTEFTNFPGGEEFEGNNLLFAPDFTYGLAMQYRSPIGIVGRFELQGQGTTFFETDNVLEQDPYALVNLRLGYEQENWGLFFFANNVFDTEFRTQALTAGPQSFALFGPPATYGVRIKAKF